MTVIGPCPECDGRGYMVNFWGRTECPKCHGKGYGEIGSPVGKSPEEVAEEAAGAALSKVLKDALGAEQKRRIAAENALKEVRKRLQKLFMSI